MLVLLSPAKALDFETPLPTLPVAASQPRFADAARDRAADLATRDADALARLFGVSAAVASLNAERFRAFAQADDRPALYAFRGDVYRALDPVSLDAAAIAQAQGRLRILSGLYGILRALDRIRPHRLEMATRLPDTPPLNVFWREPVADALADDLKAAGQDTILDLASKAYGRTVDPAALKQRVPGVRIIRAQFLDVRDGRARVIGLLAKRARGLMARFILRNRIERPQDIRQFDAEGYAFAPDRSSDDCCVFVRESVGSDAAVATSTR